jgi:DNA (cytosine-5)-methyltransferase 1
MTDSLLIRGVPEHIKAWVDEESKSRCLSQRELLLSIIAEAYDSRRQYRLPGITEHNTNGLRRDFSFIDLFAGIGGLRLGLQEAGGYCVFSSEWDMNCQKTYSHWFGDIPYGDINAVRPEDLPDHDVLAAGFPCQPFSIAGVSKKNALGRPHGFQDVAQGNLFFVLAKIIQVKRPPAILLENVKNLRSHDGGRTWKVITSTLEDLNYQLFTKIIDASAWVPQHRERVFIVGFDKNCFGEDIPFEFPQTPKDTVSFKQVLDPEVDSKYTLTDHLWKYLQEYARRHREKGNGFGFGIADLNGISRTLSSRYYKDGSEILIPQEGRNPRRLSPREAARLMGFPDQLPIVVSDTQAYKQFGNAVVPPVAGAVAKQIALVLNSRKSDQDVSVSSKEMFENAQPVS